jgi:hypothetical protein
MRAGPIEKDISVRIPRSQPHHTDGLFERPTHDLAGDARPRAVIIHRAIQLLQDLQSFGGLEIDPDTFQDIQTVFMDTLDVLSAKRRL